MAALVVTALGAGDVFLGARRPRPAGRRPSAASRRRRSWRRSSYFVLNTLLVATASRPRERPALAKVWNDHAVWSALSFVVGAGVAATGVGAAAGRASLGCPAAGRAALPDAPDLRALLRPRGGRAGPRPARCRTCTWRRSRRWRWPSTPRTRPRRRTSAACRSSRPGSPQAMGMSPADVQGVRTAALLHDIGKLAVPEHILSKPGPLTQEEFQRMKVHPQVGAEIIAHVPFPYPVAPVIQGHHERWDGKGYPTGLSGEADSARRAHSRGRRPLRRVDLGAAVPQRDVHRGGARRRADEAGLAFDPPWSTRSCTCCPARGDGRPRGRARAARLRRQARRAGAAARSRRPRRTCSRTSRWRIARSTRSTRSRSRWAPASAWPTRWRSSRRS